MKERTGKNSVSTEGTKSVKAKARKKCSFVANGITYNRPIILGQIEGIAEATASLFCTVFGYLSDKFKKRKTVMRDVR